MLKMISLLKANPRMIAALSVIITALAVCFSGCAGSAEAKTGSKTTASKTARPAWVDNPESAFGKQRYLAQVGYGGDRLMAEQNALANLTAVFGQSVQSEMKTVYTYAQAIKNGSIDFAENKSMEGAVVTSAEMDSLLGAEIPEVWFDGKNIHYAVAVMDKPKVTTLYTDLFKSNERLLANLVNISAAEKNTIYGYSRYLLAATVADVNRVYANVLTILGGSTGTSPGQMKNGDEYRLQAVEIAKTIPITVNITGDSSNRVANAFAKALNQLGFLSGGNNSRYALDGEYTVTSSLADPQGNIYVRYSLIANLRDNSGSTVLLPFSATGREGHITQKEAEERAMRVVDKKISDEFGTTVQNFLSASLPSLK
ncbi:MAG: LPP20 family lipoprotein [Treponema sp.]|jgi:hypothetical protein|nr:LPP20 family lipoprotein [Treponema sp.]